MSTHPGSKSLFAPSTWRGVAGRMGFQIAGWLAVWPPMATAINRWDVQRRLRRWGIDNDPLAVPHSLRAFEQRVYSQNGEDGILQEIFRRVGATNRFFVEIGASDGSENCTRYLAEQGWSGIWIEADPDRAREANTRAGQNVVVLAAGAHSANVAALLRSGGTPLSPDLIVVDIDGHDWWVLRELLAHYRPHVLVCEYNSSYLPGLRFVEPYRPNLSWDGTFRHGASLSALTSLCEGFGLVLVACDSNGVNAFFVATESANQFDRPGDARQHYVSPNFVAAPWGHVRSRSAVRPMAALSLAELERIEVTAPRRCGRDGPVLPGEPVFISAIIRNGTDVPLTSGEPAPVNAALRWRAAGGVSIGDHRSHLPFRVPARSARRVVFGAPAPPDAGTWQLVMTLVQERVRWLCDVSHSGEVGVDVTVRS